MYNVKAKKGVSVSQKFSEWASELDVTLIPKQLKSSIKNALLDHVGLCIAARNLDYVKAMFRISCNSGNCRAFGHTDRIDFTSAALINGTAAHGEDYDDTFEGTPVHTGAVIIPAVLATAEEFQLSGNDALRGIAVGTEFMCRMALVSPTAIHRSGFHPTGIIGALGAAVAVSSALKLSAKQMTDAIGIAGSFASGIIEYLAEGTWTKRLHAGWAAQSGIKAALLGRERFLGPRTVIEGQHGFFFAFGDPTIPVDHSQLTNELGVKWHARNIAFKPYACGTMTQPFIDCAIKLGQDGTVASEIRSIKCMVGEGTVHRLWEPLSEKRNPSTPYSAKFSGPFCVAVGLIDRAAGLAQFTEKKIADKNVIDLANRVNYEVDPENKYPENYSGQIFVTLADGTTKTFFQPHLRGGAEEPILSSELEQKFYENVAFGGLSTKQASNLKKWCSEFFDSPNTRKNFVILNQN